jgi:hydroxyquinol 1,2-dioxygenase
MRDVTPENLTTAFAAYAANAHDARSREVLCALAKHLHAFVRETRLSHAEWMAALMALTRAGQISTGTRNEFILFGDLLGVSALVDMVNTQPAATSCSNIGPFHQRGAPALPNGGDLWCGQAGEPLLVIGRVLDGGSGAAVTGARLDLWQNADNGLYSVQDAAQPDKNYHALLSCAADGSFAFTTTKPKPYSVPDDGPAGEMLRLLGRDAWRPAHLHVIAEAPGYRPLVTEIFPSDDPYLDRDAVFGVRADLVVTLRPVGRDAAPDFLAAREVLPERFLLAEMVLRLAREP